MAAKIENTKKKEKQKYIKKKGKQNLRWQKLNEISEKNKLV